MHCFKGLSSFFLKLTEKVLGLRSLMTPVCVWIIQWCLTVTSYTARLLCPWNSPGKNTGVGCHSLLQGIFPGQGLNLQLIMSPALASWFFTTSVTWEAPLWHLLVVYKCSDDSDASRFLASLLFAICQVPYMCHISSDVLDFSQVSS